MKSFNTSHILATFVFVHAALAQTNQAPAVPNDGTPQTPSLPSRNDGFVTIKEGHFYLGDRLFDFKSMNAPNLLAADGNDFRTVDTFKTIAGFGAPVTRTYTLTIYNSAWGGDTSDTDAHIGGWDTVTNDWIYNEASFVRMDQVLARAAEYGVKLIIPIINFNSYQSSTGDIVDLIRHRHDDVDLEVSQSTVHFDYLNDMDFRADYKKIIHYLLTRKNTVNGRIYGQDDVILAWETGNEILRSAPAGWTIDIAQQLKELAPNTLVMDGSFSGDRTLSVAWPEESLKSPFVDLFSYHLAGHEGSLLEPKMKAHIEKYNKVFVVGQHGFYATGDEFDKAITGFTSAGSLIWSMRSHHESGGFVTHGEVDQVYSYHFPGWNVSNSTTFDPWEQAIARSIYRNSWFFVGATVPEYPVPDAPFLWDASTAESIGITWHGAAWADRYELYGTSASGTTYELVSDSLYDNVEGGQLFFPVTPPKGTGTSTPPRDLQRKNGMTKRHTRTEHRRQDTDAVRGGDGANAPANANGGWYILRGVSVDGKPGPWSNPRFLKSVVAPLIRN